MTNGRSVFLRLGIVSFVLLQISFLVKEHGDTMSVLVVDHSTYGSAVTTMSMEQRPRMSEAADPLSVQSELRNRILTHDEWQRNTTETWKNSTGPSVIIEESSFVYAGRRYHYRYSTKALRNVSTSSTNSSLPILLVGVCSAASKSVRRQLVRATWGNDARVIFMVGGKWDGPGSPRIMEELERYSDLIWLDIPEDYRNALTPKSFALFHFGHHHDKGFDYLFKTDDDVFLNTTEMSVELNDKDWPEFYGLNKTGTAPCRNETATIQEGSKWLMTWDAYPRETFPPYSSGLGYAISSLSAFFHYSTPIEMPTTNMSHNALASASDSDASLPPLLSQSELDTISRSPSKFSLSCVEQVMATMLPMPWEDVASGLLVEACNVTMASADSEWLPFSPFNPFEMYQHGNTTVKILHKARPHWYEPLMVQGSLEKANAEQERFVKRMKERKRRDRQRRQDEQKISQ